MLILIVALKVSLHLSGQDLQIDSDADLGMNNKFKIFVSKISSLTINLGATNSKLRFDHNTNNCVCICDCIIYLQLDSRLGRLRGQGEGYPF